MGIRMLFGYPTAAIAGNWLHECLAEVLVLIHASLETGEPLQAWPELLPEHYRSRLRRRTGLRDRLNDYYSVLESLEPGERNQVLQTFHDQNEIARLLACERNCEIIGALPKTIQDPIVKLFTFAFEILTDLGIRDKHYQEIYASAPYHVCPFCGFEYFDAPGAPREALDHYLAESKYPFAAANLRNLVPMGNKCNSRYKLAQDILLKDDGTRRKSFDPYSDKEIRISLDGSQPFAGNLTSTGQQLPRWQIDFVPNSSEIETWDDVFSLRKRYERDVLDPSFLTWLRDFWSWCRSAKITPSSDQELADAIDRYATYHETMGISDRAFLKASVFRMLHSYCKQNDIRVIKLIKDVVVGVAT